MLKAICKTDSYFSSIYDGTTDTVEKVSNLVNKIYGA